MRQRLSGSSGPLADIYGRQTTGPLPLNIRVPYPPNSIQHCISAKTLSVVKIRNKLRTIGCKKIRSHPQSATPHWGPLICAWGTESP